MKILVTGVTRNTGMIALRTLAKAGHKVVGADERTLPLNIHSRYTEPYYLYPPSNTDAFIDAIIRIIQEEKPDVILPLGGTRLIWLILKHRSEIERYTRLLVPQYDSFSIAYDNKTMLEECQAIGIPGPRIFTYAEALEVLTTSDNTRDLVIKPRPDVGGGAEVYFINNADQLNIARANIESRYGAAVIQEYIPGSTGCMRNVGLLFDRDTRLAAYFTARKLRQWPTTGGVMALGISTNEWQLVETVLPFFHKWRWQGPAEVELKVDPRDNTPKVIEINPRFGGYIGFPIRCGVNFPEIACQLALDGKVAVPDLPRYSVGVKYVNPTAFCKVVIADLRYRPNKGSVIRDMLIDFRGKKVGAYFEFRDFMPTIGKILLEIRQRSNTL